MEQNQSKKIKIAQIGAFDQENFGDLLFPTVFEKRFPQCEIDMFAPTGNKKKPFEDDKYIYPIKELEERCITQNYQLIVIGGGDLIHTERVIASIYETDFRTIIEFWQFPIIIANQYQIPIILNCPGAPKNLNEYERYLTKILFENVDYISVRDSLSERNLSACGVEKIHVVPDTIYMIPEYFKKEELVAVKQELVRAKSIPEWDNYIVFQHNVINQKDDQEIKQIIKKLTMEKGKKVLLMPIGYVHNDSEFMLQLLDEKNENVFYCSEKLSPKQICAVLAGGSGYVGTSMHGAIVSYAYGKPIVSINTANMSKITGYLKLIHKEDAEVRQIQYLEETIERQFAIPYEQKDYDAVYQKIRAHFEYIEKKYIEKTQDKQKNTKLIEDILEEYHEMAEKTKSFSYQNFESAKVYYDYGNGYSEENVDEYRYERDGDTYCLSVNIMDGVQNLRIDPIENRMISLKDIKVSVDGQDVPYDIPYSCKYKEGVLINSLDPMIIISDVRGEMLTLECTADMIDDNNICEMVAYWNTIVNERERELETEREKSKLQLEGYENLLKQNEQLLSKVEQLQQENRKLEKEKTEVERELKEKEAENAAGNVEIVELKQLNTELASYINEIYQSTSWKISKPIRAIGNSGRWMVDHSKLAHKGYTAVKILQHGGVKLLAHEIKHYDESKAMMLEAQKRGVEEVYVDSEYQDNVDFTGQETDVKMLAFYLPQYHTFPENDEWWGKGFTEWTNVRSGNSRFAGHYQPRVPHEDIGYYDLTDIEVLKKQAKLAKQHGIYGFCFYYYWFSGKRLMEKPVDMLLEHPEINLPYCLCWANENWTRAWDGQNKNVLIAQDYSEEDNVKFIADLKKYIDDERYIRINGKPLVMVYNPGQIPDCHKSFAKWREVAKELGIGEILIWTCQTSNNTAELLQITDCIDAEVEFPPHNMWMDEAAIRNVDLRGKSAFLFSYPRVVEEVIKRIRKPRKVSVPVHHGCMLAWDNAARRKDAWFTYCGFSLKSLYKWVTVIAEEARKDFSEEERFVFINAWNEWGEGTYLEPDEKYGYANINTVSKALYGLPLKDDLKIVNLSDEVVEDTKFATDKTRIAVQLHMFYLDTLEETISYLNQIPYAFDCYVSTNTEEKRKEIERIMKETCKCKEVCVEVYTNRGRDVAPFLVQMKDRILQYDYMCHIHSKKTKTNDHGNEWRKYIFQHLFGTEEYLKRIFHIFETEPQVGILMPETYPVLELQAEWGGNKIGVQNLLERLGIHAELPKEPVFPVGNMFWARTDAVKAMFEYGLTQDDFPTEAGQVNATIAHQIERSWIYLIADKGYTYKKIFNNCYQRTGSLKNKKRILSYVHYDKANMICEDDLKTIADFSELCDEILFVTNSELSEDDLAKVSKYTNHIIKRNNIGYDFAAWRDSLLEYGKDKIREYDELILLNNSCYAPVFDVAEMFEKMEKENVDFWGDTLFPFSPDGSYIGKDCIPEHIQSYFMVFNSTVTESKVFWDFWENLPEYKEFIDVVAECESQFTKLLSDAGFSYAPYIKETYYISRFLNNYAIPYEKPASLVLLRDAFVKKKCYQHMSDEERVKLECLLERIS